MYCATHHGLGNGEMGGVRQWGDRRCEAMGRWEVRGEEERAEKEGRRG